MPDCLTLLALSHENTQNQMGNWSMSVCSGGVEFMISGISSVSLGQRRISPWLKQHQELREKDRDKAGKWEEGSSAVPHLSFLWPLSFPPPLEENPLYSTNHDGCLLDADLLHWSETCSSAFLIMVMDLARILIWLILDQVKWALWCVVGVRQNSTHGRMCKWNRLSVYL